jgi:zinc protease
MSVIRPPAVLPGTIPQSLPLLPAPNSLIATGNLPLLTALPLPVAVPKAIPVTLPPLPPPFPVAVSSPPAMAKTISMAKSFGMPADTFFSTRSTTPSVSPVSQSTLSSGATGHFIQMPFSQRSTLDIVLPIHHMPPGTEKLVLSMLSNGSEKTKQVIQRLEDQGMSLSLHTMGDKLFIRGSSPKGLEKELLDETLTLLLKPAIENHAYQAIQHNTTETLLSHVNDPDDRLDNKMSQAVYGVKHRYSLSPQEEMQTVQQTTANSLLNHYLQSIQATPAIQILMISDKPVNEQRAITNQALVAHQWQATQFPVMSPPSPKTVLPQPTGKKQPILVANETLKSALVKSVWAAPDIRSPDYPAFFLLSAILEGTSAGSFFETMRTRDGLVYSVSHGTSTPLEQGNLYQSEVVVDFDKIGKALSDFNEVTTGLCAKPVSQKELERLKHAFLLETRETRQESTSLSSTYSAWLKHALPLENMDAFQKRIEAVTGADIQRMANKVFNPEQGAFNRVGISAPASVLQKTFPQAAYSA